MSLSEHEKPSRHFCRFKLSSSIRLEQVFTQIASSDCILIRTFERTTTTIHSLKVLVLLSAYLAGVPALRVTPHQSFPLEYTRSTFNASKYTGLRNRENGIREMCRCVWKVQYPSEVTAKANVLFPSPQSLRFSYLIRLEHVPASRVATPHGAVRTTMVYALVCVTCAFPSWVHVGGSELTGSGSWSVGRG